MAMPSKLRQKRLADQRLRRQRRVQKHATKSQPRVLEYDFSLRQQAMRPQSQPAADVRRMLDLRSWRQKAPERQSPAAVRKG